MGRVTLRDIQDRLDTTWATIWEECGFPEYMLDQFLPNSGQPSILGSRIEPCEMVCFDQREVLACAGERQLIELVKPRLRHRLEVLRDQLTEYIEKLGG